MNNKVNYTFIGFLVLAGMFLMIWFSYWLLQPSNKKEVKTYAIYFDESVLGLNLESSVKYRGVSVGKVTDLKIKEDNSQQVEVHISILKTTPIKTSTRAKLTSQGITGLSYINLTLGDNNAPLLKKSADEKYPVIKTIPSFFETIEKSFGNVSANLSKTLSGTQKLLNEQNREQITLLLQRSASFMHKMEKFLDDDTIKHLQSSAKNLDETTNKLNLMMPKIEHFIDNSVEWENKISNSFDSIMNSYIGIKGSMDEFERAISSGEFNLKEITNGIVPTINNTVLDLQQLMIKMQNIIEQYEKSPSDLLFKQQEIKKGPGEK